MIYLGDSPIGLVTSIPIFSDKMQIEYGEYTPQTDIDLMTNPVQIFHNLGVEPNFFIFFTPNLETTNTYDKSYVYYITFTPINNSTQQINTVRNLKPNSGGFSTSSKTDTMEVFVQSGLISNSYFALYYNASSTTHLKANAKYYYIVGRFKEVTPNA